MATLRELKYQLAEIQESSQELSRRLTDFEDRFSETKDRIAELLADSSQNIDQELLDALAAAESAVEAAADNLWMIGESADDYAGRL